MKKEKSPVLVIFCIIFLSLFIILPPTFRTLIPKNLVDDIDNNMSSSNPKLIIINCNKIYPNELYQVNSKTKFVNNKATNIITYQKLETLPDNYVSSTIPDTSTAESEITYFKGIQNIKIEESENMIRFTIDDSLLNSNQTDTTLSNHLATDPDTQKVNYENLGYTCNRMES